MKAPEGSGYGMCGERAGRPGMLIGIAGGKVRIDLCKENRQLKYPNQTSGYIQNTSVNYKPIILHENVS